MLTLEIYCPSSYLTGKTCKFNGKANVKFSILKSCSFQARHILPGSLAPDITEVRGRCCRAAGYFTLCNLFTISKFCKITRQIIAVILSTDD